LIVFFCLAFIALEFGWDLLRRETARKVTHRREKHVHDQKAPNLPLLPSVTPVISVRYVVTLPITEQP
jgi:hypothetical protein